MADEESLCGRAFLGVCVVGDEGQTLKLVRDDNLLTGELRMGMQQQVEAIGDELRRLQAAVQRWCESAYRIPFAS